MIAYLKGVLAEIDLDYIVLELNNIGYQVFVNNRAFNSLPNLGESFLIYTYLQITDNEYKLYGFINKEELKLFEKLITVSGIGPKVAINVLSALEPSIFCNAIISQDEKTLTTIPGIGKKTAARLIFELKDKLADLPIETKKTNEPNTADLVEAMEVLGYTGPEVMPFISSLLERGALGQDTSFNIKLLLKEINDNKL